MSMLNREVSEIPTGSIPRFMKYVAKGPDCWEWTGCRKSNGYGRFVVNGRELTAHRFAHAAFKAPVPEGMVVDHLCRNRACVNPDHLEAVTHQENVRRGKGGVLYQPDEWRVQAREMFAAGMTRTDIAAELGRPRWQIANATPGPANTKTFVCAVCGSEGETTLREQKTCSDKCAWTLGNRDRSAQRAAVRAARGLEERAA